MPKISIDAFGGLRPRYQRRMGPVNRASVAENLDLSHGSLTPIRQPQPIVQLDECVRSFAIFGCDILADPNPCASFATGVGACHRVFGTGVCGYEYPVTARYEPGCSLDVISPNWVRLGLVQPEAVSFTVPALAPPIAAPSIIQGDQPKREHRDYVITYVSSFGEESAPSLGSADAQDADIDAPATLTIGPRPPVTEGWDIVAIRVYRMMTGNTSGEYPAEEPLYLFVDEIDLAGVPPASEIVFEDDVPASQLSEPAPLDCTEPPPEGLQGIIELETGSLAGFTGKKLWFSQPFEYHNWSCWVDLDHCIKGIVEVSGTIYVATDGRPYTVSSAPPEGDCMCCRSVFRHEEPAPLASDARGMAITPNGAIWPTNDGLVRITGNSMTLVTHSEIDETTWRSFYPSTIKGAAYNGEYYAFGRTAFNFDYTDGVYADGDVGVQSRMVTYSYNVDAVHVDKKGYMYIAMGDTIYQWAEGADYEVYRWRSQLLQAHSRLNWSAARLFFEDGGAMVSLSEPVYFTLFDGRDKPLHTVRVFNEEPFRLPAGIRDRAVEIEIRGTTVVSSAMLATSVRELSMGEG